MLLVDQEHSPDKPFKRFHKSFDTYQLYQKQRKAMAGQGSGGNVLAALCSFFIPGLGQLLQGRLLIAIVQFLLAAALWFILLGWIIHLWSIVDAARYNPAK